MVVPTVDWILLTSGACPTTVKASSNVRRPQLEIDDGVLPDLQLDGPGDVPKPRQTRGDLERADAHRDAIDAEPIGHGEKRVAGLDIQGRDRHAGQHAARLVGHGAAQRGLLCVRSERQRAENADRRQSPDDIPHAPLPSSSLVSFSRKARPARSIANADRRFAVTVQTEVHISASVRAMGSGLFEPMKPRLEWVCALK